MELPLPVELGDVVDSVGRRLTCHGFTSDQMHDAYASGRADERERWMPVLAELQRVHDALGGECFDWAPVRAAIAAATQET